MFGAERDGGGDDVRGAVEEGVVVDSCVRVGRDAELPACVEPRLFSTAAPPLAPEEDTGPLGLTTSTLPLPFRLGREVPAVAPAGALLSLT